jgi:hypothetical protein
MNKIQKILILTFLFFPAFASALTFSPYTCPQLSSNLWMGNWYNNSVEVSQLQTFLYNYYGVSGQYNVTGYYGRVTKNLVSKLQREQNLYPVTGGVGPLTRAAISRICGGVVGGDRDEHGCIGSAGYSWCSTKNKCLRTWEESCDNPVACTMQYQPVCGQAQHECCGTTLNKPAYCMYAKVNCEAGEQKTYGNICQLNAANAKYLYEGECKNNQTNEAPANCKVWYDGCNTCSRQYSGGPLMCTLMACFQNSGAYCREYFSGSTSESPVIKSFSGPTQLNINQTGTWKIEASIFNNQQLTYNITWGDEKYDYKMGLLAPLYISSVFPQNTTFEHSYSNTGTYTVTITVTAANGQSTKTTTTVNVINNNYYNNYPVACTSDARQCPNGTWVGRSGPNCEFICPAY